MQAGPEPTDLMELHHFGRAGGLAIGGQRAPVNGGCLINRCFNLITQCCAKGNFKAGLNRHPRQSMGGKHIRVTGFQDI